MPAFTTKRRVRHSAAEMFDLVADVERYPEFVPQCQALKIRQRTPKPDGTEVIVADIDRDLCRQGKDKMFNFAAHRRPEQYRVITERAGVIEPAVLDAD